MDRTESHKFTQNFTDFFRIVSDIILWHQYEEECLYKTVKNNCSIILFFSNNTNIVFTAKQVNNEICCSILLVFFFMCWWWFGVVCVGGLSSMNMQFLNVLRQVSSVAPMICLSQWMGFPVRFSCALSTKTQENEL